MNTELPFSKGQTVTVGRIEGAMVTKSFIYEGVRKPAWEAEGTVVGMRRDNRRGGVWVKVAFDAANRKISGAHWMNIHSEGGTTDEDPHYVRAA